MKYAWRIVAQLAIVWLFFASQMLLFGASLMLPEWAGFPTVAVGMIVGAGVGVVVSVFVWASLK